VLRAVLDTNVLVAALRSDRGASRRLLLAALDRRITVLLSVPLMLEYEATLTRPDHLKASGLSAGEVDSLLDAIAAVAEPVSLRFLWRPSLRDPADEMVLETAVNGVAGTIVTFNIRDIRGAALKFGIETITPPEAWRSMSDAEK
jgi:putative PIN family toxin of toxin-antitoxin system